MAKTVLLPCPFCGADAARILPQPNGIKTVDCAECGAIVRSVTEFDEQAAATWNRRAGSVMGPRTAQEALEAYDEAPRHLQGPYLFMGLIRNLSEHEQKAAFLALYRIKP